MAVHRRSPGSLAAVALLCSLVGGAVLAPGTRSAASVGRLPSLRSPIVTPGPAAVSGRITAPGGPYLYDSRGRVVFFHGVDAVYKYAPYELYPDPGKPWNFSAADASLIARLGFNVGAPGYYVGRARAGHGPGQRPGHLRPGEAHRSAPVQPGGVRPLRGAPDHDGRSARSLPHLHDPGHAPGRVQPDVRRRGRPALGRVHQRRPERRPARPLVPRVRHQGRRHRLSPLLGQQRPG